MHAAFPTILAGVPRPHGLRADDEVAPKLGVPVGRPALRVGEIASYDRALEHLAGQLDRAELDLPLRYRGARFGCALCFALEPVDGRALASELVRVTAEEGVIWLVLWKKPFQRAGILSWDEAQAALLPTGWVDTKILSFGEEVYGTRYVKRKALRVSPAAAR